MKQIYGELKDKASGVPRKILVIIYNKNELGNKFTDLAN